MEGPTLKRNRSGTFLTPSQHEEVPPGPLSGPSSNLLSRSEDGESAALSSDSARTDYGTMRGSPSRKKSKSKSKLSLRRSIRSLQGSNLATPAGTSPAVSFVSQLSHLRERPISAYDGPSYADSGGPGSVEGSVGTNGIRVWYSSFTSIDWLHDTIKDSTRQERLRRRKSLQGKARRSVDRAVGWLVVSIVGFLTAIIAFLITRSEQWLFDFKEGYCGPAWYKSKRFCCPAIDDAMPGFTPAFVSFSIEESSCPDWRTWYNVFGPAVDGSPWLLFESEMVEYIAYVTVAVSSTQLCEPFPSSNTVIAYMGYHILPFNHLSYGVYLLRHPQRLGPIIAGLRARG